MLMRLMRMYVPTECSLMMPCPAPAHLRQLVEHAGGDCGGVGAQQVLLSFRHLPVVAVADAAVAAMLRRGAGREREGGWVGGWVGGCRGGMSLGGAGLKPGFVSGRHQEYSRPAHMPKAAARARCTRQYSGQYNRQYTPGASASRAPSSPEGSWRRGWPRALQTGAR